MISTGTKTKRPTGIVGRILATLFFLFFLGMGLFFCFVISREFYLNAETRTWRPAACVIVESQIHPDNSHSESPYRFAVRYDYEWQGQTHSSTNWSRQNTGFSDYSKLQRLAARYPSDTRGTCFVDPSHPEKALLEKSSLWVGLAVLFPLIFVGVGGGGILLIWGLLPSRLVPASPSSREAGSKNMSARAQAVFFSFFLVMGAVALYFTTLQPLAGIISARNWRTTDCTIISSQLRSHRGSKSTTYRVDILYAYQVDGKEFRSNRYKFMGGSSSGQKGKRQIVDRYRPGSKAICFVNPKDPFEAVIERSFTAELWFGLLPALFVFIGVAGLVHARRTASVKP